MTEIRNETSDETSDETSGLALDKNVTDVPTDVPTDTRPNMTGVENEQASQPGGLVADKLVARFEHVRRDSTRLCEPLELEDFGLQAMPEVSPPKWHLAHTSWFFETFILKPYKQGYSCFHPRYEMLFNSYYNGIGDQYLRSQRGLLSRPTVHEVLEYRDFVDEAMIELLQQQDHPERDQILQRCELGLNHEQQHQELLCTDIKYSFSFNPLYPALSQAPVSVDQIADDLEWIEFQGGKTSIGFNAGDDGDTFHFDNELPVHDYLVRPFILANRLVKNAEYLQFIEDGGYQQPALWLSDGWAWVQQNTIDKPLYWQQGQDGWCEYTLYGLQPLDMNLPVCHVNYYEADAYARWLQRRLATEFEWEHAAVVSGLTAAASSVCMHPGLDTSRGLKQMFGSAWQWTSSSYAPYPGYQAAQGAIGEYNGKFMCNQMVLRGSSCVTPPGHSRSAYRNFFYPVDRWQFSGIRLADGL